ncbi:hypothetical protein CRUP_027329 [Coryphaenoides rupestris]|nr:hypothetical protein CRUP_027329 [Coryphaenoides rupestris]
MLRTKGEDHQDQDQDQDRDLYRERGGPPGLGPGLGARAPVSDHRELTVTQQQDNKRSSGS